MKKRYCEFCKSGDVWAEWYDKIIVKEYNYQCSSCEKETTEEWKYFTQEKKLELRVSEWDEKIGKQVVRVLRVWENVSKPAEVMDTVYAEIKKLYKRKNNQ